MVNNFESLKKQVKELNEKRGRSAWGRGVAEYAAELLENINNHESEAQTLNELTAQMLNGADSWAQYSWGGCSFIYDFDICKTLCSPSEQKRTNYGDRRPNKVEEWLDVQARALSQAAARIRSAFLMIEK